MSTTIANPKVTAYLQGQFVLYVAPDSDGEQTVWRQDPDAENPIAVLSRMDLDATNRAANWDALTARLPRLAG